MGFIARLFKLVFMVFALLFMLVVATFLLVAGTLIYLVRGRRPSIKVHTNFRQQPFARYEERQEKDVTPNSRLSSPELMNRG